MMLSGFLPAAPHAAFDPGIMGLMIPCSEALHFLVDTGARQDVFRPRCYDQKWYILLAG